jgi:hypothetical protein
MNYLYIIAACKPENVLQILLALLIRADESGTTRKSEFKNINDLYL